MANRYEHEFIIGNLPVANCYHWNMLIKNFPFQFQCLRMAY